MEGRERGEGKREIGREREGRGKVCATLWQMEEERVKGEESLLKGNRNVGCCQDTGRARVLSAYWPGFQEGGSEC